MTDRRTLLLCLANLTAAFAADHRNLHAQQATTPSMEDTIGFIREHTSTMLEVTAHQKAIYGSHGFVVGGGWAARKGFRLESIGYDPQSKAIMLSGKQWGQETGQSTDDEKRGVFHLEDRSPYTFQMSISLPTVRLEFVKIQHNPFFGEYMELGTIDDRPYPFVYSSSPEWMIVLSEDAEVGFPVDSEDMAKRVLKAVLHAIDLAGNRKVEAF